ncbi:MAG TPA: hypothetical protein VK752_05350 [Bryobacteraceae bacterium]|jgi:hypothetical protein|nr:hypothetical protein [Bryobacteraceae bacterium]
MAEAKILSDGDMFATGARCPACSEQRTHTEEELRFHPFARHGKGADGKWTHPELERQAAEREAAK